MIDYFTAFTVLLFGLCIGSFLNVCIYRLPNEASIVHPGSMCPKCQTAIAFYDNLPILSYLFLRGKCRHCKTVIPIRYPLVELLTGLMAVGVYATFGLSYASAVYFIFLAALIVITFIDIDHQIIPNVISLPGIPLFFLAAFFLPGMTWTASLLGILAGGGSLYLVAWGYHAITGKEGMGMGDVKLLAMIGALIGWQGVLFTIFMGSALGCVVGIIVMLRTQKNMKLAVPFGPFLSIGAMLYLFFGPRIIFWYFNLMR